MELWEEDGTRHGLGNEPGTVYFGLLTGPKHQVRHLPAVDGELLDVPRLGALSVTVMMRTALFPHDRSRLRNTTPSPVPVFRTMIRAFLQSNAVSSFRLPTLSECTAALDEHALGAVAANHSKRGRLTGKTHVE